MNVGGYWDSQNKEHNLIPGVYTVAAGDEWGDIVLLHFIVTTSVISEATTVFGSVSVSGSSALSTCTQLETAPLFLTIKAASTGDPINSVPITVQKLTPQNLCEDNGNAGSNSSDLGTMETDVNGTIELQCCSGDEFLFNITYSGTSYYFNAISEGAESAECITLFLPTLETTTTYSPQFQYEC